MWSSSREIAADDVVIVWLTRDLVQPLVVTPGKEFNSKFGNYRHSDLIGLPYGSRVVSRNGKGFMHVLRPTPELWTIALPHRTQILYLADIAFVTSWLSIRRGSRVVEAGTGSGSFSHSVVRTVGRSGHLWSYEFHQARANKARDEFVRHGMADIVTLTHRNVCKEGFTVEDTADAVFLDLPVPWDAVEHAKKALRKDCITRICCFSPCMEQVLRTVSALNETGFTDITMYETLLRPHEVHQLPALPSISEARDKLKIAEQRREEKRMKQIANNLARFESQAVKRKRDGGEDSQDMEDTEEIEAKKVRTEEQNSSAAEEGNSTAVSAVLRDSVTGHEADVADTLSVGSNTPVAQNMNVSKVMSEVRGHTSYLTFACLIPTTSTKQSGSTTGTSA